MPGKVKVKILAGRNLPVMDRSSDTTDAYVEIKLGGITQKTEVFRKSLNPQWNSEWFIFEVDDAELQDEPLQIRLMDYDTYSANDAIGKVYLDLNPLLVSPNVLGRGKLWSESCSVSPAGGVVFSGWLPVYDTMHGMRGEVSVIVKVELFSDVNKFRQSSCGVHFFSTPSTPCGFRIQSVQGFVKELVVNDDPEYQWIDKIRTPRASNEARQTLFSQLSGEVRRKIGLKVQELGGNAVIGYQQMFDLEGVTGLVVRGIGTAVTLVRGHVDSHHNSSFSKDHHTNGRDGLRAHLSEPALFVATNASSYNSQPHRNSLPMHDEKILLHNQLVIPNARIEAQVFFKAPVRRKTSLANLFAKATSKGKNLNTLSIPKNHDSGRPSPGVRTRSRSAPFNEMSPIAENCKELGCSQESDTAEYKRQPSVPLEVPEASKTSPVPSERYFSTEEISEVRAACFLDSSDESSDSEMLNFCNRVAERERSCSLSSQSAPRIIFTCHADTVPLVNIESNASTYPPVPDKLPVVPSLPRSPRCSTLTLTEPAKSQPAPTPSVIPSTQHGTTPTRPSSCPRRSSDSEISCTPKASSLSDSAGSGTGNGGHTRAHRQASVPASTPSTYSPYNETSGLEMLEYPFLTMRTYPPGFVIHIGGTVSARSVKLLDRINNSEEPETRDNWWTELRMEVRSHARALGCTVILGYEEHTSICEEVCVLSASGTAAIVRLQQDSDLRDSEHRRSDYHHGKQMHHDDHKVSCRVCHIPYSKSSIPFPIKLSRCTICRKCKVPDVLIATIEPPTDMAVTGRGCLIQARLCRVKRDESRGEQQAKEVSDGLPFLEYELHRQLINKLRIKGMNAIFGLRVQVSIGDRHMVGIATGTAMYVTALPSPSLPNPSHTTISAKQSKRGRVQKLVADANAACKEFYGLNKSLGRVADEECLSDSDDSDDDRNDADLLHGNKDTCILEIDEAEDVDVIEMLIDPQTPEGFDVVTTDSVPGLPLEITQQPGNLQAFNRVWKGKIPTTQTARHFNRCFEMILRSIYFKLRKIRPCVITNLQFTVDLPEDDEIQITVLGTAVALSTAGMTEPNRCIGSSIPKASAECEMIFHLEDDGQTTVTGNSSASTTAPATPTSSSHAAGIPSSASMTSGSSQTNRPAPITPLGLSSTRSAVDKAKLYVQKERQPVDIVTLIRLPGARVERYLGHLNFFFIRESTSIREDGGLSGFMQSFITEVLAIVRAHVSALGGNAMVSYFMTQCVLLHNPHKNQGQCLINVGGDVVQAVRYADKDL